MGRSKVNEQNVTAREREVQALALRRNGKTYDAIGKELGITTSGAHALVQRAYNRSLKLADDAAEFNRSLDLGRIDTALAAVMPEIELGNLKAVDRLPPLLDRRAKLLGLDKPQLVGLSTVPLSDDQLLATAERIRARHSAGTQVPLEPPCESEPAAA